SPSRSSDPTSIERTSPADSSDPEGLPSAFATTPPLAKYPGVGPGVPARPPEATELIQRTQSAPRSRTASGTTTPSPGESTAGISSTPGEGVLVPEAVRLLGADWVRWINSVASGGRAGTPGPTPGYFANGGVVAKAEGSPSGSDESAGDVLSIDVGSLERLGEVAEAVTKDVQALAKTLAQLVQQVRSHWRAIEAATNSASNNITNR